MRKLKLLFAACALLGAMAVNAQEDVTSTYLKNSDLSVDPATADNGWILVDNWRQDYQKATDDDHVNVLEFYAGWGGLDKTNYGMSQTVTLPAGDYRLAVNAFYRQGDSGNGTNNNAYIYAGEIKQQHVYALVSQSELWAYNGSNDLWKASNAFKNGQYSNEFDFSLDEETTLDLGFKGTFDEARCWVILGPVKLYKYSLENYLVDYRVKVAEAEALYDEPMNADVLAALKAAVVEESTFTKSSQVADAIQNLNEKISAANLSISNYSNLKKVIDDYDANYAKFDADGKAAADAAGAADAKAAYTNGTATDGASQIAALKTAFNAGVLATKQPGDGLEMTAYISNPGIDGNKDGWTTDMNANGGYVGGPMKPSNDAMEFWAAGTLTDQDKGKTFDYYQELKNLPNGVYTIGADLLNSTNGEEGANWNGGGNAGVYGKTNSAEVIKLVTTDSEAFTPYTTGEIFVYDGTLRIGVKNIAALTGRWFACDNFKLTYVRQLTGEDKNAVTSAVLKGSFDSWGDGLELVKVGDTDSYSCELDIEDYVDVEFKPIINGNWMAYDKFDFDAPDGWIEDAGGDDHNIKLNNRTALYKTYTITATWTPQLDVTAGWTLKIEGKDLRPKTTFTASYVNNNWTEVHAYVWNGEDKLNGVWPGEALSSTSTVTDASKTYDVYTYTYEGYEIPANTKIIFTQGNDGPQTADLDFVDGMLYTNNVTFDPVYYVIGSNQAKTDKAIFSGNWDAATTTDLMTKDGDKWTISFNNVELTEPIIFKVIKKNYKEATDVVTWYPSGDDVTISETGDFDIVITLNDGNDAPTYNCTPLTELFTVTAAGWATAITYNAVDFTGNEKIKAYLATVSDSKVTLTEATQVPAGTPLVLKGETAKVDIIATADPVTNDLQGSNVNNYVINDDMDALYNFYGLTVDGETAKFAKLNKGTIQPGKAYLKLDKSAGARELSIVFADETTGIESVAAEMNAEGVYNLNGQRVAAPAKGLYIVNGKKVVLK